MKKEDSENYLNLIEAEVERNLPINQPGISILDILRNFPKKAKIIFFFLFLSVLVLDLCSKWIVETKLVHSLVAGEILEKNGREVYLKPENSFFFVEKVTLFEETLSINYVRNFNIGFSALRFLESYFSLKTIFYLVIVLQSLVLTLLIAMFLKYFCNYYVAFAFIIAGGCGNIIDRIVRGYVVDFVEWRLPWGNFRFFDPWPVFNVADISVTVGALMLAVFVVTGKREIL